MPPAIGEGTKLILRRIQVLAGMFWIGRTSFFTKEEKPVSLKLAEEAKERPIHNTFTIVPLIFPTIGNHFSIRACGAKYNWLISSALGLEGNFSSKFIYGDLYLE